MSKEKYIVVGKLGKPHGLSGAFRFLLQRELKSKKKIPNHFMVENRGTFVPWYIKNLEWGGFNDGLILFEDITSPEKARAFSGSALYLTDKNCSLFFKKDVDSFDFLMGYKAIDGDEEIGIIDGLNELPGQMLITIHKGNKEIIIPLVENFIVKINKRKKEIWFNLPDGLLNPQLN